MHEPTPINAAAAAYEVPPELAEAIAKSDAEDAAARDRLKAGVAHVLRAAPPWRSDRITECGLQSSSAKRLATRPELIERLRDVGREQVMAETCETCILHATEPGRTWEVDPVRVVQRECTLRTRRPVFAAELWAVAALIDAHRAEFDRLLARQSAAASLADVRRSRRSARGRTTIMHT